MKMDAIAFRRGGGGLPPPFSPTLGCGKALPRRPIQWSSSSRWPIFYCAPTLGGHIAKLAMLPVCFLVFVESQPSEFQASMGLIFPYSDVFGVENELIFRWALVVEKRTSVPKTSSNSATEHACYLPKKVIHCRIKMDAIAFRKGGGRLPHLFSPTLGCGKALLRHPIQWSSSLSWPIFNYAPTLGGHVATLAMLLFCFFSRHERQLEASIALCFGWAGYFVPRDVLPPFHNIVVRTEQCVQQTLPF